VDNASDPSLKCSECGAPTYIDFSSRIGVALPGYRVCGACAVKEHEFECRSCGHHFVGRAGFSPPKCPLCHEKCGAAPVAPIKPDPVPPHSTEIPPSGKSDSTETLVSASDTDDVGLTARNAVGGIAPQAAPVPEGKKNAGTKIGCLILILMMVGLVLAVRSCVCGGPPKECEKADPCFDRCTEKFGYSGLAPNVDHVLYCMHDCEKKFGVRACTCSQDCRDDLFPHGDDGLK